MTHKQYNRQRDKGLPYVIKELRKSALPPRYKEVKSVNEHRLCDAGFRLRITSTQPSKARSLLIAINQH